MRVQRASSPLSLSRQKAGSGPIASNERRGFVLGHTDWHVDPWSKGRPVECKRFAACPVCSPEPLSLLAVRFARLKPPARRSPHAMSSPRASPSPPSTRGLNALAAARSWPEPQPRPRGQEEAAGASRVPSISAPSPCDTGPHSLQWRRHGGRGLHGSCGGRRSRPRAVRSASAPLPQSEVGWRPSEQ